MRTDSLAPSNIVQQESFDLKGKSDERKAPSSVRRSLQPLQIAAGDKENLVGAGRSTNYMPSEKEKLSSISETKPSKKLKAIIRIPETKVITVEDLTSEEGPSSIYWEKLAENRRVALEEALKENEELHLKVSQLEEENQQYKVLLDESRAIIETLNEIVNEESVCQTDAPAEDLSEVSTEISKSDLNVTETDLNESSFDESVV